MALFWFSPLLFIITALGSKQISINIFMIKASCAASLSWVSCHEMFQGPTPDLSYKPDREERCSHEQELCPSSSRWSRPHLWLRSREQVAMRRFKAPRRICHTNRTGKSFVLRLGRLIWDQEQVVKSSCWKYSSLYSTHVFKPTRTLAVRCTGETQILGQVLFLLTFACIKRNLHAAYSVYACLSRASIAC
jgi:hypothetical protein